MLVVIVCLLGFTFLGFPIWLLQDKPKDFLLTPVYGLAFVTGVAYLVSANFSLNGPQAVLVSIVLLTLLYIVPFVKGGVLAKLRLIDIKTELRDGAIFLLPAILILTPALIIGVPYFFGVVNFDFFYNSHDSTYLSTHHVLQFAQIKSAAIFPLDWSAGEQGRFSISLIGAFASYYFKLKPLHFNAQLLSTLVLIYALTSGCLAKKMFQKSSFMTYVAAFAVVFSAGYVQGYSYFLLGQISALPLFMTILVLLTPFMVLAGGKSKKEITQYKWNFWLIVLLINFLYGFYAILAFFAIAVIGLAYFIKCFFSRQNIYSFFYTCGLLFIVILAVLLLTHGFLIKNILASFHAWATVSLDTALAVSAAPKVFSEYLTEAFFPLFLGIFIYPSNASFFAKLLQQHWVVSASLLILSFLIVTSMVSSLKQYIRAAHKEHLPAPLFLALIIITFTCGVGFFITKSGYSMFKISSWFTPLILPIFLTPLFFHEKALKKINTHTFLTLIGLSVIIANFISATNYLYVFLPKKQTINNEPEILASQIESKFKGRNITLDLGDGVKNAWVAKEFSSQDKVSSFIHNFQPLEDRLVSVHPCATLPVFSKDQLLIRMRDDLMSQDVTEGIVMSSPLMSTSHYNVYAVNDIQTYPFLGQGAFPAEPFTGDATHQPGSLRWIEKGVELLIYSKKNQQVDINIDLIQGYVRSPSERQFLLSWKNEKKIIKRSKNDLHLNLEHIRLARGTTCFYLQSIDEAKPLKRYGAIFRTDIPLDFRLLNFALYKFTIKPSLK